MRCRGKTCLVALLLVYLTKGLAAGASPLSWEEVVTAAKKEGVVSVIGPQGTKTRDALSVGFQNKYPEIKVQVAGMSGSRVTPKLTKELAAGIYSTDLVVTGSTTALEGLLPAKALEPVQNYFGGPNTLTPSQWRGGKMTYTDEAQRYNLVFSDYVKAPFIYNSNDVSPDDFHSWKDLLNSKWQGKIALRDPTRAGGGLGNATLWYITESLGKEFIKQILSLKGLVIVRDDRQMLDFAARSKHPIAIGPSDVLTNEFIARGLPLKHLDPAALKEGSYITAGNGTLVVMQNAPHPNALRVYLDYLLSPEGQLAWSKASGFASLRKDVPHDHVLDILVPKEGMPYPEISMERYVRLRNDVVGFIKTAMKR
jgi:iron(III) transport system substrate-binding protein